jgi:peptidoglycan/LPS O-acetylase OafA/YrhL
MSVQAQRYTEPAIDQRRDRSGDRFITLDAMRGVAAISVMMFHYLFGTSLHLFTQAYYAVDFFFCLSGIILTHSYETRILIDMGFYQYMTRRLIRLYPFYVLGFVLGSMLILSYIGFAPIEGFQSKDYVLSVFLGLFFIPYPNHLALPLVGNITINGVFPINVPAWSLFFEMLASVALFIVIRKQIKPQHIIGASFVMMIAIVWHYDTANVGYGADNFLGGFPRTAFAFFIGVVIYRTYARLGFPKTQINPWVLLAITTAMFTSPVGGTIRLLTFLVLIPTVTCFGLTTSSDVWFPSIFDNLGRMSYGIYAIHWPIYHLLVVLLKQVPWLRGIENAHVFLAGIMGVLVICLAQLLTLFVDEPVRRRLSARYIRHSKDRV